MTRSPSSSTNFSRTLPLTCRRQRLWKLQPRTTRMSRFCGGRACPCSGRPSLPPDLHPVPSLQAAPTWAAHGRVYPSFPRGLLWIVLTLTAHPSCPTPMPWASDLRGHSQPASTLMTQHLLEGSAPRCFPRQCQGIGVLPSSHLAPTSVAQGLTPSCWASVRKAGSC